MVEAVRSGKGNYFGTMVDHTVCLNVKLFIKETFKDR